jgi:hypothetical protein
VAETPDVKRKEQLFDYQVSVAMSSDFLTSFLSGKYIFNLYLT